MFEQAELVKPGEMTFSQDVFRQRARRLTGPNPIFRWRDLEAVIPLGGDHLYLVDTDGVVSTALQLVPFLRLMPPPGTEENAVYFYNSREPDGSLRFVSYHFEGQPERPVNDAELSELLDELAPPPAFSSV